MAEHFHALRVAEITPETDEAMSIRFDVPNDLTEAFRFKAGQHLTLRADIDGEEVRRNYSLCVAPDEGVLRVTVKQIAGGVFSNWVAERLRVGDQVEAMAPLGSFTVPFEAGASRRYVGIAGGSGITPIMSLIRTALGTGPGSRFTLFYGNRDSRSVIFLEALADLKDRYMGRFELFHFLAEEQGEIALFNGMLDAATCGEAVDRLVVEPAGVDAWFICGPGPMMDSAEAVLVERGIARDRIHIERFTAGRPSAAMAERQAELQDEAAGQQVAVKLDGRTRSVAFAGQSILESALKAGMAVPYACKAGVCATCRAKCISGTVEMAVQYGLSDDEVAAGYVLTCQAVPVGHGVAVDYDA